MNDLALAIEHLRTTVLNARSISAPSATVNVDDLTELLDDHDRITGDDPAPLLCVGCLVEKHTGQRDTTNPAAVIVNGTSSCLEHFKIVDGPVMPDRTPGGIVLPGQINGN